MNSEKYLKFLAKWEFLDELPIERLQEVAVRDIEGLITEWKKIHEYSLRNDDVWKNAESPISPISAIENINPDLIANTALYNDKQIIRDPIDIAYEEAWQDPIKHKLRFLGYFKDELRDIMRLVPLMRENLIDFIPCTYLLSKIASHLEWHGENVSTYIKNKTTYRIYPNNNMLIIQIGDSNRIIFERFSQIVGADDESRIVHTITPPDLKNIDGTLIQKWKDTQIDKCCEEFACRIIKKMMIAETFSQALVTDEMITYNYIKEIIQNPRNTPSEIPVHNIPIFGRINIEKFLRFRSEELPSFISFRKEWREGMVLFKKCDNSEAWTDQINKELNACEREMKKAKSKLIRKSFVDGSLTGMGVAVDLISGNFSIPSLASAIIGGAELIRNYYDYKENIVPLEASAPFLLLNVIDSKLNKCRTNNPEPLPDKIPIDMNSLFYRVPMMNNTFF